MSPRKPTRKVLSAGAGAGREPFAPESDAKGSLLVRGVDGRTIRVGPGGTDERIDAIARVQRQRLSRQQLLSAGIARSAIDRRIANGRLIAVHRGVYAIAPIVEIPFADETAALLGCPERTLLAGHSSITIWKMRKGVARPIHVIVPADLRGPKLEGVVVHRSNSLTIKDARIRYRLPVTSPARAVLDVAPTLPDADLERVIAEGIGIQVLTIRALHEQLDRAPNHPGARAVTRVLSRGEPRRTDANTEKKLLNLIRAARLPDPETQVPMLGYDLDFFFREYNLAIEVDYDGYHASPAKRQRDKRRDARLLAERGISTIRLDPDHTDDEPAAVVAIVAAALARARTR
jgi:very-short-patch-repair endonuclease